MHSNKIKASIEKKNDTMKKKNTKEMDVVVCSPSTNNGPMSFDDDDVVDVDQMDLMNSIFQSEEAEGVKPK